MRGYFYDWVWVFLLSGFIFSCPLNPVRAAAPHYVFAHYMVCYSTYGDNIQGYMQDIQDAQAAGIDGFALDMGAYDDPTQPYYNKNVAYIYAAAANVNTNFKLFFSVEFTNTAAIVSLISSYASRPNTFYQGTNVVVSTYGQNATLKPGDGGVDWAKGVFAPLQQQGISVYFVPFFWPNPVTELPTYSQEAGVVNSYSNLVNGLFLFGAAGLPYQLANCNSNYTLAAHQGGKIFMASATPGYWGCGQYENDRRYFEFDGGEGTVLQWQSIIANQPDWVEITTWNDFGENTYLSPLNDPEQYNSALVTPHRYCHAGFTDLTRRYISWYKTGVPPATNQDALYYFYRTHSTNLIASATNDIPITLFHGDVADVIYNTLFLTAPARLQVISGTNSANYSLGAGLQQVRTPFAPGPQTFTLTRNSNTVVSVQGPPILAAITNYDYFTASGYAYGLMPPTNMVAHP
jgi:glucan endo-1,3-alpha-glucosidase